MFKALTHRPFWVNLLVVILLVVGFIFGTLFLLGSITRHGEFLTVPDVLKKPTSGAIRELEAKGFEVVIIDSVFVEGMPKGIVMKQIPDPNSTVKVNRTILLIVNRITLPMLDVPALQGKSLTYAIELLKRSHFKLGDTTFRPDFMMGSVLEQNYHGAPVNAGSKLPWGTTIDLVIGGGLSNVQIPVPNLVGMTYAQAKALLDADMISIGALIADQPVSDTANAYIIKQNPGKFNNEEDKLQMYIQSGQVMDLWISPSFYIPGVDSSKIN